MRGAPPVLMACGRDAAWSWLVGVLVAATTTTLFGWILWHAGVAAAMAWPAAVFVASGAGVLAGRQASRLPLARLAWDGHAWQLDGASGRLAVMIDAGDWLLLRWRDARGTRWLPLSPRRCGAPAHLARAAVHAHAGDMATRGTAASDAHG
jgi:hypothetical protein